MKITDKTNSMQREILFRGKRINNGEWIESMTIAKGAIKRKKDCVYLSSGFNSWYGIIPETVGQFTGLTDKNGVKIFEGDIISKKRKKDQNNFASELFHNPEYYSVVLFNDGAFMTDDGDSLFEYMRNYQHVVVAEVIGNIHDNPDLLQ